MGQVEVEEMLLSRPLLNVLIPAVVGSASGITAQLLVDGGSLASPWQNGGYLASLWNMHAALMVVTIPGMLSMGIVGILQQEGFSTREFLTGGLSAIIFALLMSSMAGCGAFLMMLIWFMISGTWSKLRLPPFRRGVWWGLGLVIGALAGAFAMDIRS